MKNGAGGGDQIYFFKNIMAENFSSWMRTTNSQIQKAPQTPRRTNKSIPRQGKKKEHTKAHHNQIAKNPRKRENLINS